jgi:hypothetical protein
MADPIHPLSASESVAPASGVYGSDLPCLGDAADDADDASTEMGEQIVRYARLSNANGLPRIVRAPRPGEPLDRRALQMLEHIDDRTPLGVLFESAGMDEGEAIDVLAQLLALGIINVA